MIISFCRMRKALLLPLVIGVWAVLVCPILAQTDAEMEECLASGKILKGEEVLVGLTKPLRLELDCGGWKQRAVFKSLNVNKPGLYRLGNGSYEFNFSDRFTYERAAYLLDRELGLAMVPVTVLRKYKATDGVLIAWISDAVNGKRASCGLSGAKVASLERQKSIMRMFDSLIYNVDRRPENFMIDESTAKLYMIDHSQSFRVKRELQTVFEENRIWMSEDIYDRLVALDKKRLAELTIGLISGGQRKSLLARRDLIVAKIDEDRREYGDESVFQRLDH